MATYTVYYTATASIPITVDVDTDGMDRDEAVDGLADDFGDK